MRADSNDVRTVEDFLCALPEAFRANYVLASNSRSLQQSSHENPRAILFNRSNPTKLIVSFNGDPKHRGYSNVEIIREKDRKAGTIELIDIAFDGSRHPTITKDPVSCVACHGTRISQADRRLLFDANPFWEGFYGLSVVPFDTLKSKVATEKLQFASFQAQAKHHSRYRFLIDLEKKTVGDFVPLISFPKDAPETADARENRIQRENSLDQNNKAFTVALASYNHRRIATLIKSSEFYEHYKYAILGSIGCTAYEVTEFVPEALNHWHTNRNWLVDDLKNLTQLNLTREDGLRIYQRELSESVGGSMPGDLSFYLELGDKFKKEPTAFLPTLWWLDTNIKQQGYGAMSSVNANFRFLFEGRQKPVPVSEWNIDIDHGNYRFNNNVQMDFDIMAVAPIMSELDPSLPKLYPLEPGQNAARSNTCDDLRAKSLSSLSRFAQKLGAVKTRSEFFLNLNSGKHIVTYACTHCHNSIVGSFAPPFNFHDPNVVKAMASRICRTTKKPLRDPKHMPKFMRLEQSQKVAMYDYFRTLDPSFECEVN